MTACFTLIRKSRRAGDGYGRNTAEVEISTPESKVAVHEQKEENIKSERVLQPPLEAEARNLTVVGMGARKERSGRSGSEPDHSKGMGNGRILRFEPDVADHRMEEAVAVGDEICLYSESANTVSELETDATAWMAEMLMLEERSEPSGSGNAKEEQRDGGTVKLFGTQQSDGKGGGIWAKGCERSRSSEYENDERTHHDAERIKALEKEVSDLMAEKAESNETLERSTSSVHEENEQSHEEKIRQLKSEVSNLAAEREDLRGRYEQSGSEHKESESKSVPTGSSSWMLRGQYWKGDLRNPCLEFKN
ncbi:hypothetical protein CBR_g56909 [Chara braunii]|uniref:Uncharacterized protein n=1 Tax=Chara braunii TaxID=69332 RepID=A0A388MDV2_CHABU|nr:hypothetical protein CBR_g56909 [Chara braunii]|eukprot:GBG92748.1 hypothetical protein CBR_g56909 [Chara braunii]